MSKLLRPTLLLALALILQSASGQILKLTPLASFGTNGNGGFYPDERDYLNSSGQLQRGLAWNPTTGHLLLACRTNAASPTIYRVLILDGVTGETNASFPDLDMSGLALGGNPSFPLNMIAVADDGAIYAANLSNAQVPSEFRLYRWGNETDTMSFPPVWFGDPSGGISPEINRRWGDTLAVRGAGINTEVLVASRGSNVCIFTPSDPSMSSFVPHYIQTDVPAGALGYGITFGAGNTFYGTAGASSGGPLYHLSYNLNAGTASTIEIFYGTNFSPTVSPISFNVQSNWLAGIETRAGADYLKIYRHNPSATFPANLPVLQDRWTWITNNNNNNFAGSVCFTTNNILYALDGDNGVMAWTVSEVSSNTLPPSITLQPGTRTVVIGNNTTFSTTADGEPPLSYQWRSNNVDIAGAVTASYTLNNVQLGYSASYSVVVTNMYGSVTSSAAALNVVSAPQTVFDAFNYPPGANLTGQVNPNNLQTWFLNSGSTAKIEADNLTYPGLKQSGGNRVTWSNASMSERLPFGTNISGSLYFSFLLRIDNVGSWTTSDTIAGFGQVLTNTAFTTKINIVSNSFQAYQLGVYKTGSTTVGALATNVFTQGQTVMVVGNYTFNTGSGNDDTCNMWLNPDPSTFGADTPPSPTVGPIGGTATDAAQISYFFFRATTHPLKKVADELRVGYSWADVTPLQAPSLTATPTGTNTVLVSWPGFYSPDFTLQSAANVATGPWVSVTNAVTISGTNYLVNVPRSANAAFFRLLK